VRAEENRGERSPRTLDKIVQFAPENHEKFRAPLLKIRQNQCACVCGRFLATQLFSLRENAIAKEPGSSYVKPWRCVSRLGLLIGGLDSFESSP